MDDYNDLRKHMMQHIGKFKYRCSFCADVFFSEKGLKIHDYHCKYKTRFNFLDTHTHRQITDEESNANVEVINIDDDDHTNR